MPLLQIVVLAVVQGITEFLPISSSGHLILSRTALGWSDPGPNFDVAVHLGTLFAVMQFYRRDVSRLVIGTWELARRKNTEAAQQSLGIAIATLPILLIGFLLFSLGLIPLVRDPAVIAWATILFALPLYWFDRIKPRDGYVNRLRQRDFLLLGLAQALAVIPGTSRAGVTITAGRYLSLTRSEATNVSMLMAVPTILIIGCYSAMDLYLMGDLAIGLDALIGAVLAFMLAWAAIWGLTAWVKRSGFTPFVIYRLILGAVLLYWIYF